MKSVGYFAPMDEPLSKNTFIYILEFPSRDAAEILGRFPRRSGMAEGAEGIRGERRAGGQRRIDLRESDQFSKTKKIAFPAQRDRDDEGNIFQSIGGLRGRCRPGACPTKDTTGVERHFGRCGRPGLRGLIAVRIRDSDAHNAIAVRSCFESRTTHSLCASAAHDLRGVSRGI